MYVSYESAGTRKPVRALATDISVIGSQSSPIHSMELAAFSQNYKEKNTTSSDNIADTLQEPHKENIATFYRITFVEDVKSTGTRSACGYR